MKIDFSAPILDLKGAPVKEIDDKDATLGSIVCTALLATYPDEQSLSGDEKVKRFRIAQAVVDGGAVDIKVDEVALLKRLLAKAFNPLIVGRAFDIIEPPVKPEGE